MSNMALIIAHVLKDKKTYAIADNYETQSKTTNNKNIEFDSFFMDESNSIKHKTDIKIGEEQKIYINIEIKNAGYIKNA